MTQSDDLFALLDRLIEARPLRAETAGPILGMALARDEAASNPARAAFKGAGSKAPVSAARVTQPASPVWGTAGHVVLEIGGASVNQADVIARWGEEHRIVVPTPREPPGSPMALRFRHPWGTMSFVFPVDGEGLLRVQIDEVEGGA